MIMVARIIDGILFFPVAIFTFTILPMITDNRTIEKFCMNVNYLYLFIGIMAVSVGIGVLQKVKGYHSKQYARPRGGVLFSIVKAIVIVAVALLILPRIQGENIKLTRVLLLVLLYVSALLLQAAFLGQRSLMGKLLALVWAGVKAVLTGILSIFASMGEVVESAVDKLGVRLTTGILELIFIVLASVLVMSIHNRDEYQSNKEYKLSQAVEGYAQFFTIDDFDCPTEGVMGKLLGEDISSVTYEFFKMLPVISMLAGEMGFLFGVGWVGIISRTILGWQGRTAEIWDKQHRRYIDKYRYFQRTDNPHYLLMILAFIVLFAVNGLIGMLLPIFIILNITIGAVIFIIKVIAGRTLDREETASS